MSQCKHPYVFPNGNCADCGVFATASPGPHNHAHITVNKIKPGSMAARLWPDKKYFVIDFKLDNNSAIN